jgi:MinD superfamily P-loop ATPase
MKAETKNRDHVKTNFIFLDTRKCTSCWKCQEVCLNHVIGKINLPFHKHARIVNGTSCTGCFKCVKVCQSNALYKVNSIS